MKRNKKPTTLEAAVQAQITSISAAKRKLAQAIDTAQRAQYLAIDSAKKKRRQEMIKVENVFEARQKAVENLYSAAFRRTLKAAFRKSKRAHRENQDAIQAQENLQVALPFIRKEVPQTVAGLQELLSELQTACRSRLAATVKQLAEIEAQSANEDNSEMPAVRAKRDQQTRLIKRELKAACKPVEARFRLAVRSASDQLRLAKAAAKLEFNNFTDQCAAAWSDFAQANESAEQSLLSVLSGRAA